MQDRPEHFLRQRLRACKLDDVRRDEETILRRAAGEDDLLFAPHRLDMRFEHVLGIAVDHRADVGRRIGGIAEPKLRRRPGDHRDHLIGDVLLHEEDAARRAALAGGAERRGHDVVGDLLGQRRRVGDHGVDAAGLRDQRHDRPVLRGERAVDRLPDLGRAGEGDAGDPRIGDERRADRAVARARAAAPPPARLPRGGASPPHARSAASARRAWRARRCRRQAPPRPGR